MTREHRFDRGTRLAATIDPASGYLRTDARLTRVGVFAYQLKDGTIRKEFRSAGEVFRAESMESLRMVPVTNDHPPVPVSAANAKEFSRGSVGDTVDRESESFLSASVTVWDSELIALAQAGKQELSCGYTCDVVMKPGSWNGIAYDAEQTGILYNHVAVVEQGRAGPAVRLHLDSGEAVLWGEDIAPEEGEEMEKLLEIILESFGVESRQDGSKLTVAGKKFDVSTKEGVAEFKKAMGDMAKELMDGLKKTAKGDGADAAFLAKLDAKIDAVTEERDELKAKVIELEKATNDEAIAKRVTARVDMLSKAKILAPAVKTDALGDIAIMRAVLLERAPEDKRSELTSKMDSGGEAYVRARFDHLLEESDKKAESDKTKLDGAEKLAAAARAARGQTTDSGNVNRVDADAAEVEYLDRFKQKKKESAAK